eukprot:1932700-Amphidinium_carterae.1
MALPLPTHIWELKQGMPELGLKLVAPAAQGKALQDWAAARIARQCQQQQGEEKLADLYVTTMWKQAPERVYKWIRRAVVISDLAIQEANGFALTLDAGGAGSFQQTLEAWSGPA